MPIQNGGHAPLYRNDELIERAEFREKKARRIKEQITLDQTWQWYRQLRAWQRAIKAREYTWDNTSIRRILESCHPDNQQRVAEFVIGVCQRTHPDHDLLASCQHCGRATWTNKSHNTPRYGGDGEFITEYICPPCYKLRYTSCAYCGATVAKDATETIKGIGVVCAAHRRQNARFWDRCNECGDYLRGGAHRHTRGEGVGDDCEAPGKEFFFPNGKEFVRNDEQFTITVPGGGISEAGRYGLAQIFWTETVRPLERRFHFTGAGRTQYTQAAIKFRPMFDAIMAGSIGDEWQKKDGNYTKRLSKYLYKNYDYQIPEKLLALLGTEAQRHTAPNTDYLLTVTRNLNGKPGEYGNLHSCWWGGYGRARCALKQEGGLALRAWGDAHGARTQLRVEGRVWIYPIKLKKSGKAEPTHDCTKADGFVVFNPYGSFAEYTAARIVAQMTGKSYKKITFTGDGIYANGSTAVLVASQEAVANVTEISILNNWKHPRPEGWEWPA